MILAPKLVENCPAKWSHMQGDDRVRHCSLCDRKVFNLSNMAAGEAKALLAQQGGGRLCVRYYQWPDGTVMTRDCGFVERAKVKVKATVVGALSLAGVVMGAPGALAQGQVKSPENTMRLQLKRVRYLSEMIREEKDPAERQRLVEERQVAYENARKLSKKVFEG